MSNPLQELQKFGQSVWYDNVSRGLIKDGSFKKMIDEQGVVGVTSNPTIFEKAIGGTADYDEQIKSLVSEGKSTDEIYDAVVTTDIADVLDIFRPVYDRTNKLDGYVSLEVSPTLAHDTEGTLKDARRYYSTINKPNLMIKIPATPEGIPAIETAISEGISVNVTLIFSIEAYEQVANAYIAGLEKLAASGKKPLGDVASVASFFVSRVDTLVDKWIEERGIDESLQGKAAIANSKLAYEKYQEIFGSERFKKLEAQGAKPQRVLWASTSTKNPKYRDVLYVEELIGPNTVDTMPPATVVAFGEHGKVAETLTQNVEQAHKDIADLEAAGIHMKEVTDKLLADGVKSFADSFDQLIAGVEAKRQKMMAETAPAEVGGGSSLGKFERAVKETLQQYSDQNFAARVWSKDISVWNKGPDTAKWLGWLMVGQENVASLPRLQQLAETVKNEGYEHVVLLGMGGSSLAPEVLRQTFGHTSGYPELHVVDTTDPGFILQTEREAPPSKSFYIVSSKSGSTTEPNMFYAYYFDKVKQARGEDKAGQSFVAITDEGSSLEKVARDNNFREIFLNQADIGGRYSALSFFGLVPAALAGYDVAQLLQRANAMADLTHAQGDGNPGLTLGVTMGTLAKNGTDKVTLVLPPELASYGLWVEQLIAESTGKEGRGIIPVAGEDLGSPENYSDDRLFAAFELGQPDPATDQKLAALAKTGHPVVKLQLQDKFDIAAEFFRWEFATAIAGSIININPFDQPNVQESKDNTKRLLGEFKDKGALPFPSAIVEENGLTLRGENAGVSGSSVQEYLHNYLKTAKPGEDYVAFLAYIHQSAATDEALQSLRQYVRDTYKVATTVGYGPRFLHSTGQLHKGGANKGVFIQITQHDPQDAPIPGEPFGFSILKAAQALGDLQSLQSHGCRAVSVELADLDKGLAELNKEIK